ncbi:MAG: hypothetical protein AAFX65_02045 [Cyanobacteria bacterium J06638_7]
MLVWIWAPELDAEPLAAILSAAQLNPRPCASVEQAGGDQPLLVAYADPVALVEASLADDGQPSPAYQAVIGALSRLEGRSAPWRLVNLSCLCAPALVSWCVEPLAPPAAADPPCHFAPADPLAALLASHWLQADRQALQAYLQLERHARSAALDSRPPDDACLSRLGQATSAAALIEARRRAVALQEQLERLDPQLEDMHRLALDNQALREQLLGLELERDRRLDLEISLQQCQADLGQMGRRIELLEQLVSDGAAASRRIQSCLARSRAL